MSDINSVITKADLVSFLGIDYADDEMTNTNIQRSINTADGELRESVGENYPIDHPLTKELALLYASASYENRDIAGNEAKRANDIALKLRLVLRRRSNESTV